MKTKQSELISGKNESRDDPSGNEECHLSYVSAWPGIFSESLAHLPRFNPYFYLAGIIVSNTYRPTKNLVDVVENVTG